MELFKCDICELNHISTKSIQLHYTKKHGIQKELMYDFSQKEFETGYELDLHKNSTWMPQN